MLPDRAVLYNDAWNYADAVTDPVVSLDQDQVAVEPGGQVSVTIKITNPGQIVEGYRIEVVGEGVADWGEPLPPEVSVYPHQDASAVVVFSPPGGTGAPGGSWPFGIRVRSTLDPDASAVAEGDLDIGKVFGLQAKLLPVNSTGRWRGVHVVQLSNWGNAAATLKLTASNPDEALGFLIRPDVVELPLGGQATARVWAKTKSPALRGNVVRIPFTVTAEREGAPAPQGAVPQYVGAPDRPSVDGAFNQKPILSKAAVVGAVLALVAVGAGVFWLVRQPGPAQATYQEFGAPDAPAGVTVTALGPDSVRVSWKDVPYVEKYVVAQALDGSKTGSQEGPATETTRIVPGLTPATTYCYAVQAKRGPNLGPFSQEACAETLAAVPTASPSPTGAPSSSAPATTSPTEGSSSSSEGGTDNGQPPVSPEVSGSPTDTAAPSESSATAAGEDPAVQGKWFAAGYWRVDVSAYDENQKLAELKALDERARLVRSSQYENMTPKLKYESWVLYLGPYDSLEQAQAACPTVQKILPKNCAAIQLEP